jgi:hypothetical protein
MKGRKPHPVHLRRFDNSCKSQPVKSTARYVFPDIGDRTIAYLGRRFMATELTAQAPWDRTDDCSSEVTSKQFDHLLLDGIDCAEFAGLKKRTTGRYSEVFWTSEAAPFFRRYVKQLPH